MRHRNVSINDFASIGEVFNVMIGLNPLKDGTTPNDETLIDWLLLTWGHLTFPRHFFSWRAPDQSCVNVIAFSL
jgi:hypothetical protein